MEHGRTVDGPLPKNGTTIIHKTHHASCIMHPAAEVPYVVLSLLLRAEHTPDKHALMKKHHLGHLKKCHRRVTKCFPHSRVVHWASHQNNRALCFPYDPVVDEMHLLSAAIAWLAGFRDERSNQQSDTVRLE
jgi:hypothetical protein